MFYQKKVNKFILVWCKLNMKYVLAAIFVVQICREQAASCWFHFSYCEILL